MNQPTTPPDVVRVLFAGKELLYVTPDPEDHIQALLRREQRVYEEGLLLDCYARKLPRGMIVDVGANIGNHTVAFAKALGRKVLAIEPNPEAFRALQANVALNGIESRVTLLPVAAGRKRGRADIAPAAAHNWGQTSITPGDDGAVEVAPLDKLKIKRHVALIKIDVEGMEYDVLLGAKQLIKRNRPLIYVELQTSTRYAMVQKLLGRWGYRMLRRFNHTPTYLFSHCGSRRDVIDGLFDKTEDLAQLEQLGAGQRDAVRRLDQQHALVEAQSKAIAALTAAAPADLSPALFEVIAELQAVKQSVNEQIADFQKAKDAIQQLADGFNERMCAAARAVAAELAREAAAASLVEADAARADDAAARRRRRKHARREKSASRQTSFAIAIGKSRLTLRLPKQPLGTKLAANGRPHGRLSPSNAQRDGDADPLHADLSCAGTAASPRRAANNTISVIMTTYNSARFVADAAQNVLAQSHTDLELIIVDDASDDDTWSILSQLAMEDARVRPVKMFKNRGTYWCKNFALTLAKGSYVTFQDSDDRSDESRLRLQLAELESTGAAVCTCNYVRVDGNGALVANRGMSERKAIMAVMFRREEVVRHAGYFDSIRTSADDEFTRRLGIVFGHERICHVDKPLYRAAVREGSLTNNDVNGADIFRDDAPASDLSFLSAPRREYVRQYSEWHDKLKARQDCPRIAFPQLRRPFPAPSLLLPESRRGDSFVTASMASIPSREALLRQAVASILPQVDVLNIYLNNYPATPAWLAADKVHVIHSSEYGDLRDNGKFFFLEALLPGYHFTIDDDIVYPPDYVQKCVLKIEQYDRRAIVGVHGVILANPFVRFMEGRKVIHFKQAAQRDAFVNLLGTGTTAYHSDAIQLSLKDFPEPGMADVWLAIAAKRQRIPMVAIQRPQQWLVPLAEAEDSSLFAAALTDDLTQTLAIKQQGAWDIRTCCQASNLCRELAERFTPEELASQGVDVDALTFQDAGTSLAEERANLQIFAR